MDINTIKELIRVMGTSGLESLEIESEGFSIKLKNKDSQGGGIACAPVQTAGNDTSPMQSPVPEEDDGFTTIKSPMVGIFNPVEGADFTGGEEITAGTPIATVEAMKMINEVEAPFNCLFECYCVNPGQTVEYGQPLVKVKKI